MANSKKSKTRKSEGKAPSAVAKQEPVDTTQVMKGLSQAQFAALLLLSLGSSYVMEYGRAVSDGAGSTACADYIPNVESCTELDAVMIRAKYYGAIVSILSVASAMLLCWKEEPLFMSLHAFLCVSPLTSTIVAIYATRTMTTGSIFKIGLMSIVLFTITYHSAMKTDTWATPTMPRLSSFQDLAILSSLLVQCKDIGSLLLKGLEGTVNMPIEGVSPAAEVLVSFLAVDKLTISAVLAFTLLFFDENRKRSMLLFIAIIQLIHWYFYLPKLSDDIKDAESQSQVVLGSAVLVGVAAFAPKITFKR